METFWFGWKRDNKKGECSGNESFEYHASAFGFYSIASWEQIKRFVGGSDIINLCFCKYHLVAVWEDVVTTEVKDGRALGSKSENGNEGYLRDIHLGN